MVIFLYKENPYDIRACHKGSSLYLYLSVFIHFFAKFQHGIILAVS